MKRTFNIFSIAIIFSLLVSVIGLHPAPVQAAAAWENVGPAGFSDGMAAYPSLAFDNGVPYVAFKDEANGYKAHVMKFEAQSGTWVSVGPAGFSSGSASDTQLVFDNGTPYVAFLDGANGNGVSVMKFNGTAWVNVGPAGFSGYAYPPYLAFDNGTPYVVYADVNFAINVMKFDGMAWVNVGPTDFYGVWVLDTSLAFDNGVPYVAFRDFASRAHVMKFDGTDWVNVGPSPFHSGQAFSPSLAFDSGVPYVAFRDGANSGEASVMKFDALPGIWVNVGPAGFSNRDSYDTSLVFDNGVPYVAFRDGANSNKASVMKFSALLGDWVDVGPAGFSSGSAFSFSLAVDNGVPYVAFRDGANGNKASVMKFGSGSPAAPTIHTPTSPTNDATPTITGTADPGNRVTVWYDDSTTSSWVGVCENLLANASTGTWTCPWPGSPFPAIAEGNFSLAAIAYDGSDYSADTFADYVLDLTAPSVTSILRASASPTSGASVDFTVTFSGPVDGVAANDFALHPSGSVTGATVQSVSGSGAVYAVTVNTGSGNGILRLDVPLTATINDAAGNALSNLPFTTGEVYTLLKAATFTDVPMSHWAWSFIERLVNGGITAGCGGGLYCAEATVTRAQMAVFLLRGIHTSSYSPPPIGVGSGFSDVPIDYWSGAWIKQLAAEGITSGCGNGNYCPEHPVTRAQMAVFLLRSKHGISYVPPGIGAGTGFGDVPPDYWAAAWIKQLVTEGITSGCGNGNYCPENPVTRAQMAVFLVKTFSLP
jgi:hypothetical protein